jgi:hypothetical protein
LKWNNLAYYINNNHFEKISPMIKLRSATKTAWPRLNVLSWSTGSESFGVEEALRSTIVILCDTL